MAPLTIYAITALALCLAPAQAVLQPCGTAMYDPTEYVCYNTNGAGLCPIINGVATKLCNTACYSQYMYTCNQGVLSALPSDDGPFTLIAVNPTAPFDGKSIEASGEHFYIGQGPSTYCPSAQLPPGACPPGTQTVIRPSSMAVQVPGGQEIYIQTDGALAYTQAHSGEMYNLSSVGSGPAYKNGGLFGLNSVYWEACPVSGNPGVYQVFADLLGITLAMDCVGFYAAVLDLPSMTLGAWQYT